MENKEFKPKVLVLAPFPNEQNSNDGFIQRVSKMDRFMENYDRVYIQTSLKSFFKKSRIQYDESIVAYKINLILHWPILLKYALNVKLIYAHTIFNLLWLKYFFKFIKAPIILDVHGTVPEEIKMTGNISRAEKFDSIEKECFNKIDTAIYVTDAMAVHFSNKYPGFNFNNIIYGIIPDHIDNKNKQIPLNELSNLKTKLGIKEDDTVVIYSGGLHIWQNIDEMLTNIKAKVNDENIVYIFLVSDRDAMNKKIQSMDLKDKRIILDSVHSSELKYYYSISHYGFVLRDDIVVNRVANPTKLIEYLFFGLTPIVKLVEIGDFNSYGYQYITSEDFINNKLSNNKSPHNEEVVEKIFSSYDDHEVSKLFEKIKR
ncbi:MULTISPECIES: hypothetical protein [unclassified Sphingobacterium]|uniref:hypothetical protein n=1 Tax=unclassified Sphingobacterium TaxID=2609468 RepID=UPI0020C41CD4|nr:MULTISPECIES: hypothetical protein [unclassified Sphingobacterium]